MERTALDFFALGLMIVISITLIYAIIGIHDIPYNIAKKRNHPHQDAIHTAGWVSLFLMHTIWPFLWIWATMYRPDRGWGMLGPEDRETVRGALEAKQVMVNEDHIRELREQIQRLETELADIRNAVRPEERHDGKDGGQDGATEDGQEA